MFCKKCGKEIFDEAVVCPHCGTMTGNKSMTFGGEEEEKGNGIAIAGFICSFFVPLLGWVFGGIGLSRANKRGGKGKRFSIAALVIASVMFFIYFADSL